MTTPTQKNNVFLTLDWRANNRGPGFVSGITDRDEMAIKNDGEAIGINRLSVDVDAYNPHVDTMGNVPGGGHGVIQNRIYVDHPDDIAALQRAGISLPEPG